MRALISSLALSLVVVLVAPDAFGQWVQYQNQTAQRLIAPPSIGLSDNEEKDFAMGDIDQDGDLDLVVVRKAPLSVSGPRRNVLFMQEGTAEGHPIDGVFVDRTNDYAIAATDGGQGFLDLTNDRDVILYDINGDNWLDIVTAVSVSDGLPKTRSHPRVYRNLGNDINGDWQGFIYEEFRIPQVFTVGTGIAVAPRFCSVAAGDVTGDDWPDLYFGDYDNGATAPPMPAGHDANDRLFVNDGTGTFTDSMETRMTAQMLESAFGMAVAIEDMNGDGVLDVVKDTALQTPTRVSISYNNPSDEGFFNNFDVIYTSAPYHITTGDLNKDGRLDIVVTDDGTDRYMINQGNGGDGMANFLTLQVSTPTGFGGNSWIADLNNDSHNDVIITDFDVDSAQAGQETHIYRNLGNVPNITLQEQGFNPPWSPEDTHDVVTMDLNGDNWLDIIYGTTAVAGQTAYQIWINQPPLGLVFSYPEGLPGFVSPAGTTVEVEVSPFGGAEVDGSSGVLHLSVNGGPFQEIPMTYQGNNIFEAELPAGSCPDSYSYFFSAEIETGGTFLDPSDAPFSTFTSILAAGTETIINDEIEEDVTSWSVENDPSLTAGAWEQADPNGTLLSGTIAAPEDDATQTGTMAFVTENGPVGGQPMTNDVDGGPTRLITPQLDMTGSNGTVTFSAWMFDNAEEEVLKVDVSNDDGSNWVPVMEIDNTGDGQTDWEEFSFVLGDFIAPTATVRVRFSVEDAGQLSSIVEAGIDNFEINTFVCATCTVDEDCDDENACTDDSCDTKNSLCLFIPNRDPCDDGNACTEDDSCTAGTCMGDALPGCEPCDIAADCEDGNACTDHECNGGICSTTDNTDLCDDGDECTENDVCSNGTCAGDLIPECLECMDDNECDDGLFCNGEEFCDVGGTCTPGAPPCPGDACDEMSETCTVTLQPRMGDPVPGLTPEQLNRFEEGKLQFGRTFTEPEGLGPIFNENGCGTCHNDGALGGSGNIQVTRFGAAGKGGFDPLSNLGGSLLQAASNDDACAEFVPDVPGLVTTLRTTNSTFGAGLVEAIPAADLLALANTPPSPQVSGIAHMVQAFEDPPGSPDRVGRFGWKAQVATMLTFSADAALNEMGITNRFLGQENAPNGDMELLDQCDTVADPEDGPDGEGFDFIDRVTDYQRFLAPPPQTPRSGMTGETIFVNIGCADCHVPSFTTGTAPEEALSNRAIKPYSDFLLHDMGQLGDGIVQGQGTEREMRTPSLWGLRVRDPMLHDGRSAAGTFETRVTNAIMEHDAFLSEAAPSAQAFAALTPGEKAAVVAFLDSLGRAEFDHDGDQDVDLFDFIEFKLCLEAGGVVTPDDFCAISDIDQDGDVDEDDFDSFLLAFDGPDNDCNGNAVLDIQEIIDGSHNDTNDDGLIDQCSAPQVANIGSRYMEATPAGGPEQVALLVTSPAHPCLAKYVGLDGVLTDTPAYQTPAAWSSVSIRGQDITPETEYRIQAEFSSGSLTSIGSDTTGKFGDTDGNNAVNLNDALAVVLGIGGTPTQPLEATDIWPCTANNIINLDDALRVVLVIEGATWASSGCPVPCP